MRSIITMIAAIVMLSSIPASAATLEANFFGASAQGDFFTAAVPSYLGDAVANGGLGCTTVETATGEVLIPADGSTRDVVIARGTNCAAKASAGVAAGDTVIMRYGAVASAEGAFVVNDDRQGVPNECLAFNGGFRLLPDEALVFPGTTVSNGQLKCVDVIAGASDVRAATFNQVNNFVGINGPCDATVTSQTALPVTLNAGISTRGPVIVPFSFWANANPANEIPFDDMTATRAALLFSGAVANWNVFKADLDGDGTAGEGAFLEWDTTGTQPRFTPTAGSGDSLPTTICHRLAGSGTRAAFEALFFFGTSFVAPAEGRIVGANFPAVFYNRSSSQQMRCVGGGCTGSGLILNPNFVQVAGEYDGGGAIGYQDSTKDSLVAVGGEGVAQLGTSRGNLKRMTFNGVGASKANLANGTYEYWTEQAVFIVDGAAQAPLANDYLDFISGVGALTALGVNIDTHWATDDEMPYTRTPSDFDKPSFD
jgi:ABC-type phosphate transport system substrate-binding protein